jgi:ribosomal-protein-alanine N-acetyltransferase
MIGRFARWFARPPVFGEAGPQDAAALADLHAAAFRRGWSEMEMERLHVERAVIADRADCDGAPAGFILSRLAADEAEILSVVVAKRRRGRGIAGRLLDIHLPRLALRGAAMVFLEVEEKNIPARRLYARAGFREVGRREGYYPLESGAAAAALVLRRDL